MTGHTDLTGTGAGAAASAAAEVNAGTGTPSYRRLLERLSTLSVERRREAYRDIAWDDPAMAIDPADPRWELPRWDPLGATDWYRDQAPGRRAAIGLARAAGIMKVAIDFEAGLQQGLVAFASTLPDGHPAFRYAYHEITEEAQHSLMFQEFVRRAGVDVSLDDGTPMARNPQVLAVARDEPVLFFLSVLGGEEPIDHIQRRLLRGGPLHPLLARINRIHCQEEARHLSFARAFLGQAVPRLDERSARRVAYEAPFLVGRMVRRMTVPPRALTDRWDVPSDVRAAMDGGEALAALNRACAAGIHAVCRREGLVPARLEPAWQRLNLA